MAWWAFGHVNDILEKGVGGPVSYIVYSSALEMSVGYRFNGTFDVVILS